jgi:hypothetical protein
MQEDFMIKNGDKVVTHAPTKYEHQQGMTCGETNVRTITEGFGKKYQPMLNPPLRVHVFGFSLIKDIYNLIKLNGLSSQIHFAGNVDDQTKLKLIQKYIDQNEPVLIAIGNGHLKRGQYSDLARNFLGHYITIYGYNAEQEIFYIYDAWLDGDYQGTIPVGNEIRTSSQLLLSWKGPFYYGLIGMRNIYLPVSFD